MFKKLRKSAFFSSFFLHMDPDPDSESGSTKSLIPDPIRIHNPEKRFKENEWESDERMKFLYLQTG
jgi:hypothetical protein